MSVPHLDERLQLRIRVGPGLVGDLSVPEAATGITVFAHGSGSSRLSPRNRLVAGELQKRGIATLLFDLLTAGEEESRDHPAEVATSGEVVVVDPVVLT